MTKRFVPVALDLEDVAIADQRLEKLRTGKTRTVPLSRLLRKYGVDRGQSATPPNRKPQLKDENKHTSANITKHYDSIGKAEMAENRAWGELAQTQMPEG